MPRINRKTKCFICKKSMEIGTEFVWGELRAYGTDRTLPMHPEHDPAWVKQQEALAEVKAEAAVNGHGNIEHHLEGEVQVAEASIIAELRNEIERSVKWGNNFVTHKRLESIINKFEVQIPGSAADISEQPGQWQIRGGNVDAIQHDGSETKAQELRQWVFDRGGKSKIVRDDDVDITYLKLDSPREPYLVQRNWWIVRTADGIFYTMPDSDFHTIYVPREEGK